MTAWTERVSVGTAILLLPLYHPVVVAKQLLDLDFGSGGRVSVGIGVGGEFRQEFDAVGSISGSEERAPTKAISILRALWSGEEVSHHGRFFSFDAVQMHGVAPPEEAPGRSGGPPIIVSGRKEAGHAPGGASLPTAGCRI